MLKRSYVQIQPLGGKRMSKEGMDFMGRIAVITGAGANGGVVHALAVGFAQRGDDVSASYYKHGGEQYV